jgi:acetolactate synthase-1/3 small subunit
MNDNILSILVENQSTTLNRIVGLFLRRGFDIKSLAVGISEEEGLSRVIMVIPGSIKIIRQLIKQLYKLVNILRIKNIFNYNAVERELMLLRVKSSSTTEPEIARIVDVYDGRILDFKTNFVIVEASGNSRKIMGIRKRLDIYGIKELANTGKAALSRTLVSI